MLLYANILSTLVKKYQLLPLTKKAVGRIIEFSSRLVDDSNNLSIDFSAITDLLQESNYMAQQRASNYIKNDDILEALRQREYRITSYNVCYTKLLRPVLPTLYNYLMKLISLVNFQYF